MSSEVSDTESLPAADETEISDNNTAIDTNDDLSPLETENNILVDISVDANNAVVQGTGIMGSDHENSAITSSQDSHSSNITAQTSSSANNQHEHMREELGIWRAADRGDLDRVKQLVQQGIDVNIRNCLGCVPLMYAAGSGHTLVVEYLLEQPGICVNIRNNDRLTTFMLVLQMRGDAGAWTRPGCQLNGSSCSANSSGGTQEQLKVLMDRPSLSDANWNRNDKWTVLMEAASFGQEEVVNRLLQVPGLELDAINIRGQTAAQVAENRNHLTIAKKIEDTIKTRDNPAEVMEIQLLENKVEDLKIEARKKLLQNIDTKYEEMANLKEDHESEMEPLTTEIDRLQTALEESMKLRLSMITRQVNEIRKMEDEIKICKRQLENFDRMYGMGGKYSPTLPPNNIFEKDFECPVCYDIMAPPSRIFQCTNGHLICEVCKGHSEIRTCPTCRVPLGPNSLLRNIPMEKLAKTYFERCHNSTSSLQAMASTSGIQPFTTDTIIRTSSTSSMAAAARGTRSPGGALSASASMTAGLTGSMTATANHSPLITASPSFRNMTSHSSSRRSSISHRTLSTPSWAHEDNIDASILDWNQ